MKFTYFPLLTGCALLTAPAAIAQRTNTGSYQFVLPSNTGADVSGSFTFVYVSPMPSGGFPLTAFTLSWLGGVNFGDVSTSDPRATFASLPTFSGSSLSGTLDVTMPNAFDTTRFLGNFGPSSASVDLIRVTGHFTPDHVGGAIICTVPEPSTLSFVSLGLLGFWGWRHYRGRRSRQVVAPGGRLRRTSLVASRAKCLV
jgi:hypothetical protein